MLELRKCEDHWLILSLHVNKSQIGSEETSLVTGSQFLCLILLTKLIFISLGIFRVRTKPRNHHL